MKDSAYQKLPYRMPQIEHRYGDHVRLFADPIALSMLARLGHPSTRQPGFNRLVERLYTQLFTVAAGELLPRAVVETKTRMAATVPGAAYRGEAIDPRGRAVLVGVARAGTLPAYVGFDLLNEVLDPPGVRVDHVTMARVTDADGKVTGVESAGSKFGGDVDGAVVFLPDPMAATGRSMVEAVDLVKRLPGTPRTITTLHLIVTPEYIARMTAAHPDVVIYAVRLDRGLSPAAVLACPPGEAQGEVGINEIQYIVPGAGGLGELMTNSDA
jgi:uracil phosphoribosyltransferase